MNNNAVFQLRQQRLARSTRPFRARGCRIERCSYCLLPQKSCLYDTIEPAKLYCGSGCLLILAIFINNIWQVNLITR